MTTQRAQQTESAASIPRPPAIPPLPSAPPGQLPGLVQPDIPELARLAGALAALAGKVDRLDDRMAPRVTRADRLSALDQAREWVTELGVQPGNDRIHAELAVARYLTGE